MRLRLPFRGSDRPTSGGATRSTLPRSPDFDSGGAFLSSLGWSFRPDLRPMSPTTSAAFCPSPLLDSSDMTAPARPVDELPHQGLDGQVLRGLLLDRRRAAAVTHVQQVPARP